MSTSRRRVLYVCHNHPAVKPGGAETYAFEVYTAMRGSRCFEPVLLARTGPPHLAHATPRPGTALREINDDPNQHLFFTDIADFNWPLLANQRKQPYLQQFRETLTTIRPDVIHFQHSLFFGVDALLAARQTLPHVPIVYTLHEFLPICHHNGQMVRTGSHELCRAATPRDCHECFPQISEQLFFLRKRFILSHLLHADAFLAPSQFLLERYVEWGIPRERIQFEEYGRLSIHSAPDVHRDDLPTRVAFFGQFTPFKGVTALLEAMKLLADEGTRTGATVPRVWLHGSNIEFFADDFRRQIARLLEDTKRHVVLAGKYDPSQLPQLMSDIDWVVLPSIWWENSPLVIQEAFACGRPVLCSNVGGMAEKVQDGINGLHFRVNDPISLAETLRRATSSRELWNTLRRGIPKPYAMAEHLVNLEQLYGRLIEKARPS